MLDVASTHSITGRQAEDAVRRCGITLNRNPIPFDPNGPWYTSGLRFGAAAVTTLGMGKTEMDEIAAVVALVLKNIQPSKTKSGAPRQNEIHSGRNRPRPRTCAGHSSSRLLSGLSRDRPTVLDGWPGNEIDMKRHAEYVEDTFNTAAIISEILEDYALPIRGDHGVAHWARVLDNGLRLAATTGANVEVVTLFALFHDSRRINEHTDFGHGHRGAEYASSLRGSLVHLDDAGFELLYEACRLHTDGLTQGDVTLQACWDADRLDLGRVGITPEPGLLCSDAARDLLEWADERAVLRYEPDFVSEVWGL